MNRSVDRRRARLRVLVGGGALLACSLATGGMALRGGSPAAAAGTSGVVLGYSCSTSTPVALTALPLTMTVALAAPIAVAPGTSLSVAGSATTALPSVLAGALSAVGVTSLTVQQATIALNASNAVPATQTDVGQSVPATQQTGQVGNPIVITLSPFVLTVGPGGSSVVLSAGTVTLPLVLHGGTFDGTVATLRCAPAAGNPPLASISDGFAPIPEVTALSPASGPASGGTSVTIGGAGFSGALAVDFGSAPATYTVDSDGQITATAPPGPAGSTVGVTVTTAAGTSAASAADQFSYVPDPFTCTAVNPPLGVSLPLEVTLAATAPASVVAGQPFTVPLTGAIVPPVSAVGPVAYAVDGGSLDVSGSDVTPAAVTDPVVGSNAPQVSPISFALDPLTLTAGSPGTAVLSPVALTLTVTESSALTGTGVGTMRCVPPAGGVAIATIDVVPSAPTVSAVSPATGPAAGGTTVTITGTGFTGATGVSFGSNAATSVMVNSDTSITATSPAGTAGSMVDVTVTTPNGTSSPVAADQFTYASVTPPPGNVPTITRMFPSHGPTLGYQLVWIFGTNFTKVSSVKFGGNSALFRPFSSHLLIALSPPASAPGKVDVTVTNAAGTSATTPADQFTYVKQFCFLFFCFG